MPIESSSWIKVASLNPARTTNSWARAACIPDFTVPNLKRSPLLALGVVHEHWANSRTGPLDEREASGQRVG
jgi:hypothetical protein